MSKKIEVVLVDDHNLFREGIKSILSQTENLSIVGTASNGKELMDYLQKEKAPDIIFMDINMPVMYGVEACTLVSKNYPGIKVIVLSMNEEQEYYHKMIQAGAKGFVQKQAGREQLEEAIKEVLNGGSYFPADILRNIIFKFGTEDPEEKKIEKHYELTKREKEILALPREKRRKYIEILADEIEKLNSAVA